MDWDSRYQHGDTPWDKGLSTPVLKELIKIVPQYFQKGTNALVPGCGIGHDVAFLCKAGIDAVGLDISNTALAQAKETYPNLTDAWIMDDLFTMADRNSTFDLIWEHTCYCAIPPERRTEYADRVYDLLKNNAYFAAVFFTNTGQPADVGPPFSTTRDEAYANFKRHFQLAWEGKPTLSYPGREGCEWVMIWKK